MPCAAVSLCARRLLPFPAAPPSSAPTRPHIRSLSNRRTNSRSRTVVFFVNSTLSNARLSSDAAFDLSRRLVELADVGPPRWFSPLECARRSPGSPLLLFLPGIDGDGLGLKLQHKKLGQIFDIWCLQIPVGDRAPLADIVALVESSVRSEHELAPGRPIYLVGESFGASLALVVAARNTDIDLVLILANPASSVNKSLLQNSVPLWGVMYKHMQAGPYMSLLSDTILWKLRMINEMQVFLDSHLHAVKAQTLMLTSGTDMVLSRMTEGERLRSKLKRCDIRSCIDHGEPLFSDVTFDLVATLKGACYYRRGAIVDHVLDFLPPTPHEYKETYETFRWMDVAFNPTMFSTTDSGKVIRGLAGIPSEGPVLLVGNHMLVGMDIVPVLSRFWFERNIVVRGMAHPAFFSRTKEGKLLDVSLFDWLRRFGAVPVSATNMYKLLSMKSHVLLYPGGIREALHGKGEEYKLMWPAEPEFVRMAARFGAKIVPFGAVGEDDILELVLDSNEQMKIPPLKALIKDMTSEAVSLRNDAKGEVGQQVFHYPGCLPKVPGRLYFLFGKPISMQGRKDIMRDKDKAKEMYIEIQMEIEKCISYLKVKRETDPYRNLLPRFGLHGTPWLRFSGSYFRNLISLPNFSCTNYYIIYRIITHFIL